MKKLSALFLCAVMVLALFGAVTYAYEPEYKKYDYSAGMPNTGIMDFSWLNEMPAGTHGAVNVKDGDFVFEDGTPVRFWGVDLGFAAATPDKAIAEIFANELASSGVNFARLHAIDCTYSGVVDFTGYQNGAKTGGLKSEALDRMDYLIHCLKEKGIYVHLDTSAGRVISTGDGFTAEEVKGLQGGVLRGFHVFEDRISDIELDFATALMSHENPYTGLKYCEDPVIAVVQRMNESSVLWIDGSAKDNVLIKDLEKRYNEWLLEKYGSREELAKAWTGLDGTCALFNSEDPAKGNVQTFEFPSWNEFHCPPTEYYACRQADYVEFLMELQQKDFTRFCETLKGLGYKGTINCSNYPTGPQDLYLNSMGDVVEKNCYWGSCGDYSLPASVSTELMTYENPAATTGTFQAQMTYASVVDKAMVVTEWQALSHLEFKADAVFQVACYAALQDWDGFCMFNYSFDGGYSFLSTKNHTDFFAFHMDPNNYGEFGMCAAIFRLGLIKEAENEIEYVYTRRDAISNNTSLGNGIFNQGVYLSKVAYRFLEDDEAYNGDADLVIASGNLAYGDYRNAKHLVLQSYSDYDNVYSRKAAKADWQKNYYDDSSVETKFGKYSVNSNGRYAVMNGYVSGGTAVFLDDAMRHFGLLDENEGFSGDVAVSDTGELIADGKNHTFTASADRVAIMTGVPVNDQLAAGDVTLKTENDLVAFGLLAVDDNPIAKANNILIYTIGRSHGKAMIWEGNILKSYGAGGIEYEKVLGTVSIPAEKTESIAVYALDADGNRIKEITDVTATETGYDITLDGHIFYEIESVHIPEPKPVKALGDLIWIIITAIAVIAIIISLAVIIKNKKATN